MSTTHARTPRKRITGLHCANEKCGREFVGFRTTARYCSDDCRHKSVQSRKYLEASLHWQTLQHHGPFCDVCGKQRTGRKDRFFVWPHPAAPEDAEQAFVLCGLHHYRMSRSEASEKRRHKRLAYLGLPPEVD